MLSSHVHMTQDIQTQEILIDPRQKTSYVKFNATKGVLIVKGNANELNEHHLIDSIATLVNEHLKFNYRLSCYFFLKHLDSGIANTLLDLFKELKEYVIEGKKININWFADFDNPEIIDAGYDYSDILDLKFNIQQV